MVNQSAEATSRVAWRKSHNDMLKPSSIQISAGVEGWEEQPAASMTRPAVCPRLKHFEQKYE